MTPVSSTAEPLSLDQLEAAQVSEEQRAIACLEGFIAGVTPLRMFHQPIVDLARGVATGYEALVRFPEFLGTNPLDVFVRARRLGFGLALEKVVLLSSLETRKVLPPNCFLSVNASPALLMSEAWVEAIATFNSLSGVVIEVTEMDSISDYSFIRTRLDLARALGAVIAVDDAGAGFASLQHVIELKPNFIKLDRMFITNCHDERAKTTLIEMLGRTADRLDAWLIAEGVESAAELDELILLGVPLGQGYHLGNPVSGMQPVAEDISEFIQSRRSIYAAADGLLHLVQECRVEKIPEHAHAQLASETTLSVIAVIDQWKRPVEFVERHPLLGIRRVTDVLKVQLNATPSEIAHRALARPPAFRFDPVVVINNRGEFHGIIPVDRLLRSLLS